LSRPRSSIDPVVETTTPGPAEIPQEVQTNDDSLRRRDVENNIYKREAGEEEESDMLVRDVMSSNVVAVAPNATLATAAKQMRGADVGWLPVIQDGDLRGVVTDRDIVVRGISEGLDPSSTPVQDVMSDEVVWCQPTSSLEEAAKLMEGRKIRRLLVKDETDELVGALSLGDVAVRAVGHDTAGEVLENVSQD
jgi:CBS domain-containing protein